MDTLLVFLGIIFIVDGFLYFLTKDDQGLYSAIGALSILILVKSFYVAVPPYLGGVYALWAIRALCVVMSLAFIPKSVGVSLRTVARDSEGNLICDENGVPLMGRKAKKFVEEHRTKTTYKKVTLMDVEGNPLPDEISDAVNEYFRTFLKEDGSFKEKDEDGTPITEEYVDAKIRQFIAEKFGMPSISGDELVEDLSSLLDKFNSITVLDTFKELDAETFVKTVKETFDMERCKDCCDYGKCSQLPKEEWDKEHDKCLVEMLDSTLLEVVSAKEFLEKEEEEEE